MNILLIEDDEADVVCFQRSLSTCTGRYLTHVCDRIEQALSWLDNNHCEVILLDMSLPDCFGLSGIRQIHQRFADLPIVILTGLDDDQTALDALEHGAQDYLVKGNTNSRELQRTLRHAVQRQQILNENRRLVSQLQIAARSDALTGVLNRHAMTEEFELHWSGSNLSGCPLSCVILDVDKFKAINDQFGHLAGDEVLRTVARVISDTTRPSDFIARYGGEEFCVILVGATELEAVKWAERARFSLRAFPFELAGDTRTITASFGVSERSETTQSIEQLIDQADQALMIAKKSGRDRVRAFSDAATAASSVSPIPGAVCPAKTNPTSGMPESVHFDLTTASGFHRGRVHG
jgi:diguanylate cyclase (GGDEF)-like protein